MPLTQSHPHPDQLTLREKRVYFTSLACELVTWINQLKPTEDTGPIECAIDEWTVHNPRLVKVGTEKVLAEDRVHHPKGMHPRGLACDLLVYVNGTYVTDGTHWVWRIINEQARSMDPNFGLGLHFNDANHLSYGEGVGG